MSNDEMAETLRRIEGAIETFNAQIEHNTKFMESFGIGFATSISALCEALISKGAIERSELINWLSAADLTLQADALASGLVQEADVHRKGFAYLIGLLREKKIQRH